METGINEFGLDGSGDWDNCEKVGRFEAFIPKLDLNSNNIGYIPKHIRIGIKNSNHILRSVLKDTRRANIGVNKAIGGGDTVGKISFKKASQLAFFLYKMRNDKGLKLAFIGLLIAILGLTIDGSFAIGKAGLYVKWQLSNSEALFYMTLALVLKAIGLILVFIKALGEKK